MKECSVLTIISKTQRKSRRTFTEGIISNQNEDVILPQKMNRTAPLIAKDPFFT